MLLSVRLSDSSTDDGGVTRYCSVHPQVRSHSAIIQGVRYVYYVWLNEPQLHLQLLQLVFEYLILVIDNVQRKEERGINPSNKSAYNHPMNLQGDQTIANNTCADAQLH